MRSRYLTLQKLVGSVAVIGVFIGVLTQWIFNDKLPIDDNFRIISGIIIEIIIIILAVILLLIPFLKSSVRFKSFRKWITNKLNFSSYDTSIFNAEIVDKKLRYVRGEDSVRFRSKFDGKLSNGFFANQIFTPEHVDGTTVHVDYFDTYVPDVSEDRRYVTSRCKETQEYMNDNGKLDGKVKIDWKEWSWDIPEYSPLGLYKVKMMVWNTFEDGKKEPFRTIEDTFAVIDPDNSHYQRFNNINIG